MLFSSKIFLFIFLPFTLLIYFTLLRKHRKAQNIFLLIISLFFYAYGEPKVVFLMMLSIFINWFFGILIDKYRENNRLTLLILICTAIFNLGLLFIYKYLSFSISIFNRIFGYILPDISIALPIGISFFTFQGLSYVFDVYRRHGKVQKNPLNVGVYIAFFPQLIAGPIVRYETIAEQLENRKESLELFYRGTIRFIIGLSKKVILSNTFALIADSIFGAPSLTIATAWIGALAYTLQIFYDFSGYSDMAIGMGKMFGFEFLENFDYPYISKSITEFWRRWHISLGTWFRDYVYIPLGGSRVKSKLRLIFNLFVVWFLTGLWHGAKFTFIVWGLMYFTLLVFEKLSKFPEKSKRIKILPHLYTLFFVIIGWVIFRSDSLGYAIYYLKTMFGLASTPLSNSSALFYVTNYFIVWIIGFIFTLPLARKVKIDKNWKEVLYHLGLIALLLISISYIVKNVYNPFIYFNF